MSGYHQKHNNPIMFALKSKIIRCTALDHTKDHILADLDIVTKEKNIDQTHGHCRTNKY